MQGNPFTYGNPISDPSRFFGRAREVEQIFGRLRNEEFESSSVVGERRIGKTSLLNYLADPGVRAARGLDPERYAFIILADCSGGMKGEKIHRGHFTHGQQGP